MHFPDKLDQLAILCALLLPVFYAMDRAKSYWRALLLLMTHET